MSSYQAPKVLLTTLTERTSAKGNVYLTGWLAKARIVGFRDDDDEHGNPVWNLYLSEPERRENGQSTAPDKQERLGSSSRSAEMKRQQRASKAALEAQARQEEAYKELNDAIPL